MTLVSVVMMLITMTVTVGMFYNLFSEQVMEDLKTHVHILKTTEAVLDYVEKGFDPKIDNLRITVIDKDGEVKYDSNADIGTMDNHVNRPEIKQALKTGEGKAERKSNTLDKTTYYYAEKMENAARIDALRCASPWWKRRYCCRRGTFCGKTCSCRFGFFGEYGFAGDSPGEK